MKKKLLTLAMIGVLSLTAVGFGYAKWSSTVDAKVTINTGSLILGIRDVGTNDDGSNLSVADLPIGSTQTNAGQPGADPQWGLGINGEGKDVAKTISTNNLLGKVGTLNGVDYYDSITETITNGYPYYGPSSEIEIANLGSVPAKIEDVQFVWDNGLINNEYMEIVKWTVNYPDSTTATGSGLDALKAALLKYQLHGEKVIKISFQQGIRQTAKSDSTQITPQNANGSLSLKVIASQWNEVQ